MIENYVDPVLYLQSYAKVHPRRLPNYSGDLNADPFEGGVRQPNKVAIAEEVVSSMKEVCDRGKLRRHVIAMRDYIRRVNGLQVENPH